METQIANLDLAAAINILNAVVSLINENTNLKAVVREQQSLLAEQPEPSPGRGTILTPEGEEVKHGNC